MTPVALRPCRIIPAYAGSTVLDSGDHDDVGDHPRIRGEHQCAGIHLGERSGSSPHTRGARPRPVLQCPVDGIIPAYAGSTRISQDPCDANRDHPRIRGEHTVFANQVARTKGSSPHTRGARAVAPAGSRAVRDHPRIRGEHRRTPDRRVAPCGSSPHTRGAPGCCRGCPSRRRIIPAYAGSTTAPGSPTTRATDHPRIRGEHSSSFSRSASQPGSSPHTRGALDEAALESCERGIIPAYAGSTISSLRRAVGRGDHPRIRGEHVSWRRTPTAPRGSSPHTRGALVEPFFE